eukprot:5235579-Amphidinium_carterae.5
MKASGYGKPHGKRSPRANGVSHQWNSNVAPPQGNAPAGCEPRTKAALRTATSSSSVGHPENL